MSSIGIISHHYSEYDHSLFWNIPICMVGRQWDTHIPSSAFSIIRLFAIHGDLCNNTERWAHLLSWSFTYYAFSDIWKRYIRSEACGKAVNVHVSTYSCACTRVCSCAYMHATCYQYNVFPSRSFSYRFL